jgi:hypothetical protein
MQPNPQAQQAQQAQQQAQQQLQQAQTAVLQAQAAESQSRAKKYNTEAEIAPKETVLKYMDTNKDGLIDADVKRKMELARVLLEEDKWQAEKDERQQRLQMEQAAAQRKAQEGQLMQKMLQQNEQQLGQVKIEEGVQ